VTATVDSIPLSTASILSKKLAGGLDALVIDVKVGSGAFATSIETAIDLTENLLAVAEGAGLRTAALLTDMSQVLGHHVGNALEVREALGGLTGRRRVEDAIDPSVGLADVRGVGDAVDRDRPIAIVHARSAADAERAAKRLREAVTVSDEPSAGSGPPILRRMAR